MTMPTCLRFNNHIQGTAKTAIGELTSFIHYVQGLKNGNQLTQERGNMLMAAPRRIIDNTGLSV